MRSRHIHVAVDLDRVRAAAESIRATTRVDLIAVVKADAYGLGAVPVADALAPVAAEFAYFSLGEAREVGRPGLVLGPPEGTASDFRALNLRPTIFDSDDAERFRGCTVTVSVDTGMQRFGCPPQQVDDLLSRCAAVELSTHAAHPRAADLLRRAAAGRGLRLHAACSALLEHRGAWLDAVRPGVALYRGALRVTTRLASVRATSGPAGYTGFDCPHVGIILGGYSHRLAPAPVLINGRRQRLIEVGMNSSFVSVDPRDRPGDVVVLLGDELTESDVAAALRVREHEVLCRYASMGQREYTPARRSASTPPVSCTRLPDSPDPAPAADTQGREPLPCSSAG